MPGKSKLSCHYGPTNSFVVATPIGDMCLVSCPKGLHFLNQADSICDENFCPDPCIEVCIKSQLYQDNGYQYKPSLLCVQWLRDYFSREHSMKNTQAPPMCPSVVKDGSFTAKVWKTLTDHVGFGQTISYGGLAKLCGNANACRAVGHAMGTNPVQLVMPCHRVVQSNGNLGNYAWGKRNSVKQWLLVYEGAVEKNQ
ncbi:methylated-DNA--protein-cysteine methyltransferase-like isoform X2 [Gigantopelta aegis]|nr:methylated-DNA--protein-cysteine methyltransferase-like isoform X2 [Gigantopelta aegis]XP_041364651.1 methylated-DNA--protein-cysteine methyltransferase-like isoform X2 [Gigantopelta aegis]XP_041364652.1 methylated-DNA--protein-cysteine methyltransferase-like isoform X2 [Gigantopelta aegis]XP_041364653.1 methylated-DNA--protein-cysteine methyltransferase-like isoform X2 [Gigantopelta aegis]XP_041364654.1 methylated-DNA--protein-cysteine methyltransferase-like isoform X2 [Gigantopelta aegis]